MGAMIKEYGKIEVRNKKLIRGILIAIIGILLLLVVIKMAPLSHKAVILPIKQIQIYGNELVTEKEIARAIALDVPKSILAFNRRKAKQLLLQDLRVSRVTMTKLYPDTLRIYVRETAKEALLISGGAMYWIGREGIVLSEITEAAAPLEYPFITLNGNNDDIITGEKLKNFLVHDVLSSVGGIRQKYPDFYNKISSFSLEEDGVYVMLTNDLYSIYFGYTVNQEKLERLRALLVVLESEYLQRGDKGNTVEIDMSSNQAAVRIGEMRNEP
jgi:cell division protein FtsQ